MTIQLKLMAQYTIAAKGQDPQKIFDGNEKDLIYDEILLLSLYMKGNKLKTVVQKYVVTLKEEAKTLNDQYDALYCQIELGTVMKMIFQIIQIQQ